MTCEPASVETMSAVSAAELEKRAIANVFLLVATISRTVA
jgi:hypothetical protein